MEEGYVKLGLAILAQAFDDVLAKDERTPEYWSAYEFLSSFCGCVYCPLSSCRERCALLSAALKRRRERRRPRAVAAIARAGVRVSAGAR